MHYRWGCSGIGIKLSVCIAFAHRLKPVSATQSALKRTTPMIKRTLWQPALAGFVYQPPIRVPFGRGDGPGNALV